MYGHSELNKRSSDPVSDDEDLSNFSQFLEFFISKISNHISQILYIYKINKKSIYIEREMGGGRSYYRGVRGKRVSKALEVITLQRDCGKE